MTRKLTNVRLEQELLDGLQKVKDHHGIPISVQVRIAIRRWLNSKDALVAAPPARPRKRKRT